MIDSPHDLVPSGYLAIGYSYRNRSSVLSSMGHGFHRLVFFLVYSLRPIEDKRINLICPFFKRKRSNFSISRQIDSALLALGLKSPGSASRQTGAVESHGRKMSEVAKLENGHGNGREFIEKYVHMACFPRFPIDFGS